MPPHFNRDPYTPELIEQLTEWYLLGRETRRQDPVDSAKRAAAEEFVNTVAKIRDEPKAHGERQYTYQELSKDILVPNKDTGELEPLNHRTLRALLYRHDKEKVPVSQRDRMYKGISVRTNRRTADHFSCQHEVGGELVFCERTPENTYLQKLPSGRTLDICARHKRLAAQEHRERKKAGLVTPRRKKVTA